MYPLFNDEQFFLIEYVMSLLIVKDDCDRIKMQFHLENMDL